MVSGSTEEDTREREREEAKRVLGVWTKSVEEIEEEEESCENHHQFCLCKLL
jgi:hypothetical protein